MHGGVVSPISSPTHWSITVNDLHSFNPATNTWVQLFDSPDSPAPAVAPTPPRVRLWHGFTSAGDKLYAHGGYGGNGGIAKGV